MVRAAAVLALGICAAFGGCRKDEEAAPAGTGAVAGEEVEILRAFPASPSGGLRAETKAVVKDGKAWEELWRKANEHLAPVPAAPTVDFAKEMVAVFGAGERTSGGWSAEIVGVRKVDGKVRLLYAVREPEAGAVTTQVITRPWHAVVLPLSGDAVEWVEYRAPGK